MKKTGGYIRMAGTPNLRKQDGPKPKLLCKKCDNELLAVPEDYFSKTIFLPYLTNRVNNISYDKRLAYFLVSVLWRAWVAYLSDMKAGDAGWDFRQRLQNAETQWRAFLLHGQIPSEFDDIHLFLTDKIERPEPLAGFTDYVTRGVDWTVAANSEDCVVYVKFANFLIFGNIAGRETAKWQNTKICFEGGMLSFPQTMTFGALLLDRAQRGRELFVGGISEKQRRNIDASARDAGPDCRTSGMLQ